MLIRAPRVDVAACSGAGAPFGAVVGSPSMTILDPLRPRTLSLLSFPVGALPSPSVALKLKVLGLKFLAPKGVNEPKRRLVTTCSLLLR